MTPEQKVSVARYDFDQQTMQELQTHSHIANLWPIVYILSHGKKKVAYVGETTDALNRLSTHFKYWEKRQLTTAHLIASNYFNKSATLDIEANLIKYLAGDGVYQLLNANMGLANHNYYQKDKVYWSLFESIWNQLRQAGITRHSLDHINNSDLFKYSPYKSLSGDQIRGLQNMLRALLDPNAKSVLIEGGAGTGKTILAIFLFKLLKSSLDDFHFGEFGDDQREVQQLILEVKATWPDPQMALVIPMASFRKTIKQVFKNIKGLTASMVIGPAEVIKKSYDIVLVDEAHRLRKRTNLGTYFGRFDEICRELGLPPETTTELDWIGRQARRALFFYDRQQSIKPSDVNPADFEALRHRPDTIVQQLQSQFRVKGGNAYVHWVERLLDGDLHDAEPLSHVKGYDVRFFEQLPFLAKAIQEKNESDSLARLIAGYAWAWNSRSDPEVYDIEEDGIQLRWNSETSNWINSENAPREVGCIHTTQGYDLNYAGIIFGHEIDYDPEQKKLVVIPENYHDKTGKMSISDPEELRKYILNIYQTILLRGIKGTYVYACNENMRQYLRNCIEGPATESKPAFTILPATEVKPFRNSVPVYDLRAAAGTFGELQHPDEVSWVAAPHLFTPRDDRFACTVIGESMNRVIPNGALCLFRRYSGGSRNGLIVLVEYTKFEDADLGSCYTVKEYRSRKVVSEEGWQHEAITLKPLSDDPAYEDIELAGDDLDAFRVIGVFEKVLG